MKDAFKCLTKSEAALFRNSDSIRIPDSGVANKEKIISDFTTNYPGQCFTLDQQCKLIIGGWSRYCNGVS